MWSALTTLMATRVVAMSELPTVPAKVKRATLFGASFLFFSSVGYGIALGLGWLLVISTDLGAAALIATGGAIALWPSFLLSPFVPHATLPTDAISIIGVLIGVVSALAIDRWRNGWNGGRDE